MLTHIESPGHCGEDIGGRSLAQVTLHPQLGNRAMNVDAQTVFLLQASPQPTEWCHPYLEFRLLSL